MSRKFVRRLQLTYCKTVILRGTTSDATSSVSPCHLAPSSSIQRKDVEFDDLQINVQCSITEMSLAAVRRRIKETPHEGAIVVRM
jgi:hypothetical protein